MGLTSAGDDFIRPRVDEALDGISSLKWVVEDILIYDKDYQSHVEHVRAVLQWCKRNKVTLHAKKCAFGARCVKWCGYRILEEGYTIDEDLCAAIAVS